MTLSFRKSWVWPYCWFLCHFLSVMEHSVNAFYLLPLETKQEISFLYFRTSLLAPDSYLDTNTGRCWGIIQSFLRFWSNEKTNGNAGTLAYAWNPGWLWHCAQSVVKFLEKFIMHYACWNLFFLLSYCPPTGNIIESKAKVKSSSLNLDSVMLRRLWGGYLTPLRGHFYIFEM